MHQLPIADFIGHHQQRQMHTDTAVAALRSAITRTPGETTLSRILS